MDVKEFTRSVAKKVRLIEIQTDQAVDDVLAGEYSSVFKGSGMEFEEVREYAPGDEIRSIDWNVTARMGKPFVKRYVEERELTIWFLVDLSASGSFGSRSQLKSETAAEFCALLAFAAIRNNDKVGLVVFTDRVELSIAPSKGRTHVLRLIRELLRFSPQGRGTDLGTALEYLGRVTHKRGVVFLVSDFLTPAPLAQEGGKRFRRPRVRSGRHWAVRAPGRPRPRLRRGRAAGRESAAACPPLARAGPALGNGKRGIPRPSCA